MWIVKNSTRAVLKIEGTPIEISPGEEVDLDIHGRQAMDRLEPLMVAFEEGYLENVYKEAEREVVLLTNNAPQYQGMRSEDLEARLDSFKSAILGEIRSAMAAGGTPPQVSEALINEQLGLVRDEFREGVKGMMDSLDKVKGRLSEEKNKIINDRSLSMAEVKARLAFIEEKEREITSNFETVGHEVDYGDEGQDGDVMGNADLLSNI